MICAKSPIFIKTTGIDRLQSEKSRSASSDMEDALWLVKLKKTSNIRKNCFKTQKKNPQRREARQGFLWCTQQDSNLWPFDS